MADGVDADNEYLERAQGLAALIEASADQAERERRLPEPLFTALVDAGLFRLLLPRSLDGAEVDPVTFVRVVEAIARTVTQQLQGRQAHLETVGQFLLGLETDTSFL